MNNAKTYITIGLIVVSFLSGTWIGHGIRGAGDARAFDDLQREYDNIGKLLEESRNSNSKLVSQLTEAESERNRANEIVRELGIIIDRFESDLFGASQNNKEALDSAREISEANKRLEELLQYIREEDRQQK